MKQRCATGAEPRSSDGPTPRRSLSSGVSPTMHSRLLLGAVAAMMVSAACAPRATPLAGTPSPRPLPRAELAPVHQRIVFRWTFAEAEFTVRGEGVARIAPPDSARLDFFVQGGYGGGRATMIGEELIAPNVEQVRRMLPPPPMLWAALGRLTIPSAADTTVRVDGDVLRADIGRDPVWRVSFRGTDLTAVELIRGGRVEQRVTREGSEVRYQHTRARRRLDLTIVSMDTVPAFDAEIWR